MATYEDVRHVGLTLPEVEEARSYHGTPALKVRGRPFCRLWSEREHQRDGVFESAVLVVFCDPDAKEALIEASGGVLFETPHYRGYGAMLIRLDDISIDDLRTYLVWSYRLRAPRRLAALLEPPKPVDWPLRRSSSPRA